MLAAVLIALHALSHLIGVCVCVKEKERERKREREREHSCWVNSRSKCSEVGTCNVCKED